MKALRSPAPFTLALLGAAALAGCSQSQGRQIASGSDAGSYPARMALGATAATADSAPLQPEGAAWQPAMPNQITFGLAGQPPLLAITCSHDASGAATVRIQRGTRAEDGAKALFALIGNGRVARLPLDARQAGETGLWEGALPAADPRLDVLRGGAAIEATLPGGGTLKLPASSEPGRLLAACRASDSAAPARPA